MTVEIGVCDVVSRCGQSSPGGDTERRFAHTADHTRDARRLGDVIDLQRLKMCIRDSVYADNEVGKQKISNAFWLNEDTSSSFQTDVREDLATELYTDSKAAAFGTPEADTRLNEWIVDQAGGQIDVHINTKVDDRLAFISAFQFYDEWIDSCNPEETTVDAFYLSDGSSEDTTFVHKLVFSPLHRSPQGYVRSELQLKNGNHMVIVLPDEGVDIDDLVTHGDTLRTALEEGDTTYAELAWQVPTFSLTTDLDLADATRRLGLEDIFTDTADFSSLLKMCIRDRSKRGGYHELRRTQSKVPLRKERQD